MTDAQLLALALRLPAQSPGSATKSVFVPGRAMVGSFDPGMIVPEDDPQKLASSLAFLRERVAGQNPFEGNVIGDTPGGAQSALLNLRAQNIQMQQEAARLAESARQAELSRNFQREMTRTQEQLRGVDLMDRLKSSASARDIANQEAELRRLLGIGNLEISRINAGARNQPVDTTAINRLLPYGREIDAATGTNQAAMDTLLGLIQARGRDAARQKGLTFSVDRDGLPVFDFVNPAQQTSADALYAAEDLAYTLPSRPAPVPGDMEAVTPARDLRAELNQLIAEQNRLAAGRQTYEDDLRMAMAMRDDRRATQVPQAVDDVLTRVLTALKNQAAPAPNTVQTAAQRLLAERGSVVGGSPARRVPAPKPAKRWVLSNGAITRN